jgi:hypothetical protein
MWMQVWNTCHCCAVRHAMEMYEGVEACIHLFLALALGWGEWPGAPGESLQLCGSQSFCARCCKEKSVLSPKNKQGMTSYWATHNLLLLMDGSQWETGWDPFSWYNMKENNILEVTNHLHLSAYSDLNLPNFPLTDRRLSVFGFRGTLFMAMRRHSFIEPNVWCPTFANSNGSLLGRCTV